MARLTLIRGVPGSGKTYLAHRLAGYNGRTMVVSADTFMTDSKGDYKFDPSRLEECHAECLQSVKEDLFDGFDVVVDNTFIKIEHMKPYLDLVDAKDIAIYECWSVRDNVHGVPDSTIRRMIEEFEPYLHDATKNPA